MLPLLSSQPRWSVQITRVVPKQQDPHVVIHEMPSSPLATHRRRHSKIPALHTGAHLQACWAWNTAFQSQVTCSYHTNDENDPFYWQPEACKRRWDAPCWSTEWASFARTCFCLSVIQIRKIKGDIDCNVWKYMAVQGQAIMTGSVSLTHTNTQTPTMETDFASVTISDNLHCHYIFHDIYQIKDLSLFFM